MNREYGRFKSMVKNAIVYKMVILYVFLFSFNSLASAIIASFLNTDWQQLKPTAKFILVVVILQSWTGTMLAFFNKSIQRAEQGQPFIPTGQTDLWVRQAGAVTPVPGAEVAPIQPKPIQTKVKQDEP